MKIHKKHVLLLGALAFLLMALLGAMFHGRSSPEGDALPSEHPACYPVDFVQEHQKLNSTEWSDCDPGEDCWEELGNFARNAVAVSGHVTFKEKWLNMVSREGYPSRDNAKSAFILWVEGGTESRLSAGDWYMAAISSPRDKDALRYLDKAIETDPDYPWARYFIVKYLNGRGSLPENKELLRLRYGSVEENLDRFMRTCPVNVLDVLRVSWGIGNKDFWEKRLPELREAINIVSPRMSNKEIAKIFGLLWNLEKNVYGAEEALTLRDLDLGRMEEMGVPALSIEFLDARIDYLRYEAEMEDSPELRAEISHVESLQIEHNMCSGESFSNSAYNILRRRWCESRGLKPGMSLMSTEMSHDDVRGYLDEFLLPMVEKCPNRMWNAHRNLAAGIYRLNPKFVSGDYDNLFSRIENQLLFRSENWSMVHSFQTDVERNAAWVYLRRGNLDLAEEYARKAYEKVVSELNMSSADDLAWYYDRWQGYLKDGGWPQTDAIDPFVATATLAHVLVDQGRIREAQEVILSVAWRIPAFYDEDYGLTLEFTRQVGAEYALAYARAFKLDDPKGAHAGHLLAREAWNGSAPSHGEEYLLVDPADFFDRMGISGEELWFLPEDFFDDSRLGKVFYRSARKVRDNPLRAEEARTEWFTEPIPLPEGSLPDLNDTRHDLGGQDGLMLLNFWATWCGPCRQEMPALEKVLREFPDDVKFWAVSIDKVEIIVGPWLTDMDIELPVLTGGYRYFGELEGLPQEVPMTLFVKDGRVYGYLRGYSVDEDLQGKLLAGIELLRGVE